MGGCATRIAKNLGVAKRSDVQAIVDDANAQTAVLRNQVIGTQQFDIKRAPTRLFESAMGNMVADAMRLKYPGVDAAYTNSGGLRQDLLVAPPSAGEQPGEITWGEMFSVLPFGNRSVILTLTGAQLEQAFINGFTPILLSRFHRWNWALPADLRFEGHLHLQWHNSCRDRYVEDAARHQRTQRRRSARRTPCASSPTTSCTRAAMVTPCSRRVQTSCSRAMICCKWRLNMSQPTHQSGR